MPTPRTPSEESRCDALIAQTYGVSAIVRLGQKGKRTPNTQGVPDRLYWCGEILFWEVKSKTDYLSVPQIDFLTKVLVRRGLAGCGNREDLLTLLNAVDQQKAGWALIEKYRTRRKALRAG
jgi:hypothetical protein